MKKKRKTDKTAVIVLALYLGFLAFAFDANNRLCVTELTCQNAALPAEFEGFCIVQVSDLHNKEFLWNNSSLLKAIRAQSPDIIVITGDVVDTSTHTDTRSALKTVGQLAQIAPTYYVTGNHEHRLSLEEQADFYDKIAQTGTVLLDDRFVQLTRGGAEISLLGLDDNSLGSFKLDQLVQDSPGPVRILLAHEPQYLPDYAAAGVDLVFTGHAHGGQWRIPFTHQGLYAPDQGLLPDMTEGVFTEGGTSMVVSRGLGNSAFPLRAFNRPELIVMRLTV